MVARLSREGRGKRENGSLSSGDGYYREGLV